jgi:hypothetical protein
VPSEVEQLRLWEVLKNKGTDLQRVFVQRLVDHAAPILDRVIETFPTYTLHSAVHARNVAELMASLLGPQLQELRPLEAALLILSAYYHDIGMVFREDERSQLTKDPEWRDFLQANAAAYVAVAKAGDEVPLDIAEWYCRWRHADRVFVYLNALEPDLLKWGPVSILEELGSLCRSHNQGMVDLRTNERLQKNFLAQADLKFCAIVLRIADILDFDRTRSPDSVYGQLGLARRETRRKEMSDVEWRKHLSSDGVVFPQSRAPNYELDFIAGPDEPAVENDVRAFLTDIEREFGECSVLLEECSPRWRDFVIPAGINRENIHSNGYRYGEYRFSLDQDNILALLMGEKLYSSPHVFVREILQNSIDAVRLRTYVEHALGNDEFKPNSIRVTQWIDRDRYWWIRIDDDGTGMDEDIVRNYLLKVGSSYYNSAQYKAELMRLSKGAESGFTAISRFGIGLLSCFLACDRVEISSRRRRPDGQKEIPVRLSLEGLHGFFVMQTPPLSAKAMPSEHAGKQGEAEGYRKDFGTSIACRLDPKKERGALDLRAILDEYIIGPVVPVELDGEPIGSTAAELSDAPWVSYGEIDITPDDVARISRCLDWHFEGPLLKIVRVPIDLTNNSPNAMLRGQCLAVYIKYFPVLENFIRDAKQFGAEISFSLSFQKDFMITLEVRLSIDKERFEREQEYRRRDDGILYPRHDEKRARLLAWASRLVQGEDRTRDYRVRRDERMQIGLLAENDLNAMPLWIRRDLEESGVALEIAHNGIRIPSRLSEYSKMQVALQLGSTSTTRGVVLLTDRLRPELTVARDRLVDLPWEVHSAATLTAMRAIRRVTGDAVSARGDFFSADLGREALTLGRLLRDPLLQDLDHWGSEPIFESSDRGTKGSSPYLSLQEIIRRGKEGEIIRLVNLRNIGSMVRPTSYTSVSTPVWCAAALATVHLKLQLEDLQVWYYFGEIVVTGIRTTPVLDGEKLFAPTLFVQFDAEARLLRSRQGHLNSDHPFAQWLLETAPRLAERYPGIFEAIKAALANPERGYFEPEPALAELVKAIERLGQLEPELRVPSSAVPAVEELGKK